MYIRTAKSSVRPSACLSVTLRFRDHTGWNSSKIISLLVSLRCSLQTPTPRIYSKRSGGTPWNFDRNRGGVSKKRLSAYKSSKLNISETRQDRSKVTIEVRALDWCKNQRPQMTSKRDSRSLIP